MKYEVKIEIEVQSIDLVDIEVIADSKEEAKQFAIESYNNDPSMYSVYASDYMESKIALSTIKDWEVEEI